MPENVEDESKRNLDKFVDDLARQLLTLVDEGTGKEVPLTPFELQYVGEGLAKFGKQLVDRGLRKMTRGGK